MLKLRRHVVVDDEVEISEGAYIEYLIIKVLEANPKLGEQLDREPIRKAFAHKVGSLYTSSVQSGEFVSEVSPPKWHNAGAALGWWTDDI